MVISGTKAPSAGALCACSLLWVSPVLATKVTQSTETRRATASENPRLALRADHVVYVPQAGCKLGLGRCPSVLRLRGHVSLDFGSARLEASRADLRLDARGRPLTVEASGGVHVALGARQGRANRVRFSPRRRQLVLEGKASLRAKGAFVLRGERIEVDLAGGRVTVQDARMEIGASAPCGPTDAGQARAAR